MTEITETKRRQAHPRPEFRSVFVHDWLDVTMIHFEVSAGCLGPMVPFDLDIFEGKAYVSLVMFRLDSMRTPVCPWLSRQVLRPISDHRFLNIRTYVRCHDERGIYFMTEWLENRLAVMLGPVAYGLPYRLGRFEGGGVSTPLGRFAYGVQPSGLDYSPCGDGSLDAFLMERYSAFTLWRGRRRVFRIRHKPWLQRAACVDLTETGLLFNTEPWFREARLSCAHQSPGLVGVELSGPLKVPKNLT
jgi:uncharacterized protein